MKLKTLKRTPVLIWLAVIALVSLLQALTAHFSGFHVFQRLEWMTYDWRVRQANRFDPIVAANLGFVSISDDTLALFSEGKLGTNYQFGLYWPRRVYGQVVRELHAQGAKGVGLDVLFGERRPDHPPWLTPDGLIASDVFFAQQLKQAGQVVLAATKDVFPVPLFRSTSYAVGDISNERDADGVLRRVKAFQDYRLWHSDIQTEARLSNWDLTQAIIQSNHVVVPVRDGGRVSIPLNPDGYFDPSEVTGLKPAGGFVRLQKAFEDVRVWHMGIVLAALELSLNLDQAVVDLEHHRIVLSGSNRIERIIPVDGQGQLLVDWSVRQEDARLTKVGFERLVAHDIVRPLGTNIAEVFRNKLVIVGSTATGSELSDRGATPLDKDTLLTSNHWNVINSLLTNRFIRQASLPLELALIWLLGLSAGVLNWRFRTVSASVLILLCCAGYVALAFLVFVSSRYWLPLVMPVAGALLAHFALVSYRAVFEQNERRRIKNVFGRLVSPSILNELLKAEKLSLEGARRKLTVFFADVRGFTEMTDVSHAQAEEHVRRKKFSDREAEDYFDKRSHEVLHTVNLFLGLIADVIRKHEGTLDKYIGDCVMAFWGAPVPNDRHALAGVRAAIDAQRAIFALNQERAEENRRRQDENRKRAERGEEPLQMLSLLSLGSGINTGVVTVGLMGSEAHGNYTVFGREVNLASRLEGISGRDRIIIGEATYLDLLHHDPELAATCIERDPVPVKGFRAPVKNFEVPWRVEKPKDTEPASSQAEVIA